MSELTDAIRRACEAAEHAPNVGKPAAYSEANKLCAAAIALDDKVEARNAELEARLKDIQATGALLYAIRQSSGIQP